MVQLVIPLSWLKLLRMSPVITEENQTQGIVMEVILTKKEQMMMVTVMLKERKVEVLIKKMKNAITKRKITVVF